MKSSYPNVAVFSGSRFGNSRLYAQEAQRLGHMLGQRKVHLIYGGGDSGLMGEFSGAAHSAGARVTAVIPSAFRKKNETTNLGFRTVHVETLFQRKDKMIFESDLAISLPGGVGTFDEDFEVMAYNDIGKYKIPNKPIKPLILINTDGHFDGMRMMFDKAIEKRFMDQEMMSILHWAQDADDAIEIYDGLCAKPAPLLASLRHERV